MFRQKVFAKKLRRTDSIFIYPRVHSYINISVIEYIDFRTTKQATDDILYYTDD